MGIGMLNGKGIYVYGEVEGMTRKTFEKQLLSVLADNHISYEKEGNLVVLSDRIGRGLYVLLQDVMVTIGSEGVANNISYNALTEIEFSGKDIRFWYNGGMHAFLDVL